MIEEGQLIIIQLRYLETGWAIRTLDCIHKDAGDNCDIFMADREGVGNMSLAFNRAMEEIATKGLYPEFVWMVTNITFEPGTVQALIDAFDDNTAAVHPKFASDHPHIINPKGIQEVPFVEWTAPMVRYNAWRDIGPLDEDMPYWGMDLDWSYRAKQEGYSLKATAHAVVNHTYLRHNAPEPISKIRKELRYLYDSQTEQALVRKYGIDYRHKVWQTHPNQSTKALHG